MVQRRALGRGGRLQQAVALAQGEGAAGGEELLVHLDVDPRPERARAGQVQPGLAGLAQGGLLEADPREHRPCDELVALGRHMHAIARQPMEGVGLPQGVDERRVEVDEHAPLLPGEAADEVAVGAELLALRAVPGPGGGRREQDDLDPGLLAALDDRDHVGRVAVQRQALGAVDDVVHPAADGRPIRALGEDVAVEPGQHVVGLMAADARGERGDVHAVDLQAGDDQADVAMGVAPALRGDAVAEEGDLLLRLEQALGREGRQRGEQQGREEGEGGHGANGLNIMRHRALSNERKT